MKQLKVGKKYIYTGKRGKFWNEDMSKALDRKPRKCLSFILKHFDDTEVSIKFENISNSTWIYEEQEVDYFERFIYKQEEMEI